MAKAGWTPEQINAEVRRVQETIYVTEREMRAIALFSRVQTQWNHSPSGGLMSLNYQGVEVVARALEIELDSELLRDLQVMETTVVREIQERGRRNSSIKRSLHR